MDNISIKNRFLLYLIFIVSLSIFYLYYKHDVGTDTSISEWLINYQGGFTRRGLGGEVNIFFANVFSIPLRDSIFFIQVLNSSIYIILLYNYVKDLKFNIIQIFAIFSPLFLIYPLAELEALGRKEVLIFLFFISTLFFSGKEFRPVILNSIIFIFFPLLCLIWEQIILFAPFFAVILINKNKFFSFSDVLIKLPIIFSPSIFVIIIIFLFPLSKQGHTEMCSFLINQFEERCYMSADLLIKNTIYFDTFYIHKEVNFFPEYFRYIMIFLIGFFPLHLSLYKNRFILGENFVTKYFSPLSLFICLYIPILLLFAFGHDWGRWMNITYSLSILLYLYFLKEKVISTNFNNYSIIKIFSKKKFLLILVFYLFAFSWNPKTLISGDIATNTLYKIIYNSSKIIFGYEGIRILQDNPIIQFHKKFIE